MKKHREKQWETQTLLRGSWLADCECTFLHYFLLRLYIFYPFFSLGQSGCRDSTRALLLYPDQTPSLALWPPARREAAPPLSSPLARPLQWLPPSIAALPPPIRPTRLFSMVNPPSSRLAALGSYAAVAAISYGLAVFPPGAILRRITSILRWRALRSREAEDQLHALCGSDYVPPLPEPVVQVLTRCCLCFLATSSDDSPHLSLMRFSFSPALDNSGAEVGRHAHHDHA